MSDFIQALFILAVVAIVAIVFGRKFGTKMHDNNTNSDFEVSISKVEENKEDK